MTSAHQQPSLFDLLITAGFSEVKAELWSRFVEATIRILDGAGDRLRQPDAWFAYTAKRGAISTPKRKGKTKIERVPIEDGITAELGHIARRLRLAVGLNDFLRQQEVVFETEYLIESTNRTGRYSRKVDFFIYSQVGPDSPELALEAKPLRSIKDIEGRYLAEEGIGCFFTADSVYTTQPLAGMIAYTTNEGSTSHLNDIKSALEGISPPPPVSQFEMPPKLIVLLLSHHDRDALGLPPVAILHFEMIFPIEQKDSPPEAE